MNLEQHGQMAANFEFDELLERCMGNLEFAERVLTKFQGRFDGQLEEMENALAQKDVEQVVLVAHRLKGESASVAASGLRDRAEEIERLGRGNRVADIPTSLQNLRSEWASFAESVASCGFG